MIESFAPASAVRRFYHLFSPLYGVLISPVERPAHRQAVAALAIAPGERALEVAVGPGIAFLEILAATGKDGRVFGLDFAHGMLLRTSKRARAAGHSNFCLVEGDACKIPFATHAFDALYNAYMFDLLPLSQMKAVLGEFRRVLKPGGRLALLNSTRRGPARSWYERFYGLLPGTVAVYLVGGCRPVLTQPQVEAAGFCDVRREVLTGLWSSELVLGRAP